MEKRYVIEKRYVSSLQKKMFLLAFLTAAFTEFTQIIALTVDSIIVCRFLGEEEIAAVGVSAPFLFLVGIFASALSSGLQTVCSQDLGRGRIDEVSRRFSEVVLFSILCLLAATAVIALTIPQIAVLFGARGNAANLHGLTVQYLYGLCFEVLPFVLMSVLTVIVILDNGGAIVMISSVAGCLTNIGFDILAVSRQWGLFGIGLGSSVSVAVSLGVLLLHFLKKDRVIRFRLVKIRLRGILEVLRMGLPKAVHSAVSMIRAWLLNALVIHLGGSVAMSVMTINGTIVDFVDILSVGIAGAVGILSGIGCGEMNGEDLESIGVLGHRFIAVTSFVVIGILVVLNNPISRIFLDPSSSGYPLLRFVNFCIAASIIPNALIYARVSYLQALGNARGAQLMEAAANLVFLFAFALGLSPFFGVYGVFAAFPASKILVLIATRLFFARKAKKVFPKVQDYMNLDPAYYSSAKHTIDYPIQSLDECVLASEQVGMLCRGHKFDKKTAYFASVCVEEIAANVLQHGGASEKDRPLAEIRITVSGDHIIFRIRDNGRSFQMSSLAKMVANEKDPAASIGLKIICAAAEEINYYRIYGMNTTIIRIARQTPA